MLKTILIACFLIQDIAPIDAAIEIRDTIPLNQCDTIIDKNGVVSRVKILSVTKSGITYKQCSGNAKRTYTIATYQVESIKSTTFTFEKPQPKPLLTKVKRAKTLPIISGIALLLTTAGILDSDSPPQILGIIFLLALFAFVGSVIYILTLLRKAKKTGDKEAHKAALKSIFITLLTILGSILLISRAGCF